MFKSENDLSSKKLPIVEPLLLSVNANSTVMQFVINTDATSGTIEFSVVTRNSNNIEPLFRPDGITQVVVDLSTTEKTILLEEGMALKEIHGSPSGLNGTYYEVIAASGDR